MLDGSLNAGKGGGGAVFWGGLLEEVSGLVVAPAVFLRWNGQLVEWCVCVLVAFDVVEGDAKVVLSDEVDGTEGDVEIGGEGDVGKESWVLDPLGHAKDEGFVVAVEL